MKTRSTKFWTFLILGFLFIALVTFFFLHCYLDLCVPDILKDKTALGPERRKNLFTDLLYIPGSLLVTAALFYLAGRYLGGRSGNVSHSGDADLRAELEECRKEYDALLVQTSGGKLDKSSGASSASTSTSAAAAASSMDAKTTDESGFFQSDLDKQMDEKKKQMREDNASKDAGASSAAASKEDTSTKDFNADQAKAVFGKKIKVDDLKLVEGIGPKIESMLKENNINTWKDLSNAKSDDIFNYLIEKGGPTYKIHDPSTWPKQAKLAAEGKFDELKELQDHLKGGREV